MFVWMGELFKVMHGVRWLGVSVGCIVVGHAFAHVVFVVFVLTVDVCDSLCV